MRCKGTNVDASQDFVLAVSLQEDELFCDGCLDMNNNTWQCLSHGGSAWQQLDLYTECGGTAAVRKQHARNVPARPSWTRRTWLRWVHLRQKMDVLRLSYETVTFTCLFF